MPKSESRRRWQCPQCLQVFAIPDSSPDPVLCRNCAVEQQTMEVIEVSDDPPDPLPRKPSPAKVRSGDFFICQNPNCDFQGQPLWKSNGSIRVLLSLILGAFPVGLIINAVERAMIEAEATVGTISSGQAIIKQAIGTGTLIGVGMFLIGIAYSAVLSGYARICPKCGMTLRK